MAVRLERLKIHRFRDVAPGTELRFSHGWNVLLGRNATGKTTLLHLISMALRGNFQELRGEDFDLEYELTNEEAYLKVRLANERQETTPTTQGVRGKHGADLSVESLKGATWEHQFDSRVASLSAEVASGADIEKFHATVPSSPVRRPTASGAQEMVGDEVLEVAAWLDDAWPTSDAARRCRAPEAYRFDEAVELYRCICGRDSDAAGLPARVSRVISWEDHTYAATPLRLSQSRWVADQVKAVATAWSQTFEVCANLSATARRLDGDAFTATYAVTSNKAISNGRLMEVGAPTILLHRHDGDSMSIDRLSFGQKRLFAFAWYLDANPDAVVADELVNGMHYEWIEDCVHAMEGRQVFVTAQNPLLLDHVPVTSPDDVTRSFVLCSAARDAEGRRAVRWANPSPEQAAEFFRAYENGLLRVHEILRTEGLW